MKKLFFLLAFAFLSSTSLFSQTIQLVFSPHPSSYISDWVDRNETVKVIINNTQSTVVQAKIKSQLYNGSGDLIGETSVSKMPLLSLPTGITTYSAEDLLPYEAVKWYGTPLKSILATGRIPEDNYKFCVQLVNPTSGDPLTVQAPQCSNFTIISYIAPTLLAPLQDAQISAQVMTPIFFKWTPVAPYPNMIVTYRLQIWEVLEGQDKITALRNNQPIVEKDIKGSLQTQWPVDFAAPEVGKSYVWTVSPLDDQDRKLVDGSGFAEPFGFSITEIKHNNPIVGLIKDSTIINSVGPQIASDTSKNQGTLTAVDSSKGDTAYKGPKGIAQVGDTIYAGLNGEFKMVVITVTINSDSSLTGTGVIAVNLLSRKFLVEFSNIFIDPDKILRSGGIVTAKTPDAPYSQSWTANNSSSTSSKIPKDVPVTFNNAQVDNVLNWMNANENNGHPIVDYSTQNSASSIQSEITTMPVGLKFKDTDANTLMITDLIFEPNVSKINFLVQKEFSQSDSKFRLGFAGKFFKVHPMSIEFKNGRIELLTDINIPSTSSDPKMRFAFKNGSTNNGCYIQWSDSGLVNINIGLDVKFSRKWLVPDSTSSDTVAANFSGSATGMDDILLSGSLPACQIVGSQKMKLDSCKITLDLSDKRNPDNLTFPSNYPDSTTDLTWQGLYINSFTLTLPETWKTGNAPPQINASNIVIDNLGLTANIKLFNVITFPKCKVADLSASIDTIQISIVHGSLTNGGIAGKIVLPISNDSTTSNCLNYSASFSQDTTGKTFQIVIVPAGPIQADILKGAITLDPTSNITAFRSPDSLKLSVSLDGKFSWKDPNLSAGDPNTKVGNLQVSKNGIQGLEMELDFKGMTLEYKRPISDSTGKHDSLQFHIGNWDFASPQKKVAHFPVTINNIYYKALVADNLANSNKELLKGAIMFGVAVNLDSEISAKTTLGAVIAIDWDANKKKFKPKFKGITVDSLSIHADLPAVKIDGSLVMYNHDDVFGDGFSATISVTFTPVDIQAKATVQFGETSYQNNNQLYRYWRVEANLMFDPGIPFLGGVGFYGFGGGAYCNMQANKVQKTDSVGNGSTYTFKPHRSSWGFQVMATFGTFPKVETLNADVSLLAQFSSSGGLTQIDFNGDFWVAAKLTERSKAKMYGNVSVDYNVPDKIFSLSTSLSINVEDEIKTVNPLTASLYINGKSNKWYFKCGTPTNPNAVRLFDVFDLYGYFMFGNYLGSDVPDGFTQMYKNDYRSVIGSYPGVSPNPRGGADPPGANGNISTGQGIAFGVGVKFDKEIDKKIWCCHLVVKVKAGAEVDLSFLEYTPCSDYLNKPFGINHYRAYGGISAYLEIYAKCGIIKLDLRAGAWCQAKFPKPTYANGSVYLSFKFIFWRISWTSDFEYGTDCPGNILSTQTVVVPPEQDVAADYKNKLIQYVSPTSQNSYNFPVNSTINVKYSLVPDQVFTISENTGYGTKEDRTFKFKVTTSCKLLSSKLYPSNNFMTKSINIAQSSQIYKSGGGILQTLNSTVNNEGMFQYYTTSSSKPVIVGGNISINPLTNNNGNSLLTKNGNINSTSIPSQIQPSTGGVYPNTSPTLVNGFISYSSYSFDVYAELQELIDGKWTTAISRKDYTPIKQSANLIIITAK